MKKSTTILKIISFFFLLLLLIVNTKATNYDHVLNIAHRGSSGEEQEHTESAYRLAIEQGADFIECDLCLTKDLVPVCTHDCDLRPTTDIEKYVNNITTNSSLNNNQSQNYRYRYYTYSHTWLQLESFIRVKRKLPTRRDRRNDYKYGLCSFEKYLQIATEPRPRRRHNVGVYPELKEPQLTRLILRDELTKRNTSFEKIVVDLLLKYGYDGKQQQQQRPRSNVYLQTFDKETARNLSKMGGHHIPVIFLTNKDPDQDNNMNNNNNNNNNELSISAINYYDTYTLEEISAFTSALGGGLGVSKSVIFQNATSQTNMHEIVSKTLVLRAHQLGMRVHVYTFRLEDDSVPFLFGTDIGREYDAYLEEGVDGLFTDYPLSLKRHLDFLKLKRNCSSGGGSSSNGGGGGGGGNNGMIFYGMLAFGMVLMV